MKRILSLASVAVLIAACADQVPTSPSLATDGPSLARAGAEFVFTTIEIPGAQIANVMGVNSGGDIVGTYRDASGASHGFLLRNGEITTLDFPGAVMTEARAIGPGGEIVGTYRLAGEPGLAFHGFLRTRQGEYVSADYPGHLYTIAQRILPDGTILGCRHDNDFMESMRGVRFGKNGTHETDAFASMHNGATPDLRRIAGLFTNMETGRTEGYVIDDGAFKPFIVPGSSSTAAWDVNVKGDIVGVYGDTTGTHGFLRSGDQYTIIDVPGADVTQAYGINARGDIVGRYFVEGTAYGFLARRK